MPFYPRSDKAVAAVCKRPARHYPRFRIWRPSPERQWDFNPPDLGAAQRTLRIHLPPCTASFDLESPLESPYPLTERNDTRLPQLPRTPCEQHHPQTLHRADQEQGFALFCTLTHPWSRNRFTCAVSSSLPIASFRPCRCQQRPCDSDCLPPGRGDACIFQQAGFARYARQTKKRAGGKPALRLHHRRPFES
jgi:hypothetical protein